jgi:lysophospholipase L1-like esterase
MSEHGLKLNGDEMLECLIVGDSIAVGTARERPECVSYSRGGWNSANWNRDYLDKAAATTADTVRISLGSNDYRGIDTRAELEIMRASIQGTRVFWIMPAIKPKIQSIVQDVADQHGDVVLPIIGLQRDGVHPNTQGYRAIANSTKVK